MTSTFVLNTQLHNIKFRILTLSIKSDAQKQMVESSFEHNFDAKYLEVGFFFRFLLVHRIFVGIITKLCRKTSI